MPRRAFTLIELLVVIAIIAILAAILFPVFAQAKAAAKKSACLSNSKQAILAAMMYASDYDDAGPIIQYTNTYNVAPPNADKAIGNLLTPYQKNFDIWTSPMDDAGENERVNDPGLPMTVNNQAAQYKEEQRQFNLAIKSNYGQNTQYFSPMLADPTTPTNFRAVGTIFGQVEKPAETIYMINSIWDRVNGVPAGGGNWGLDMPCRRYSDGTDSLPSSGGLGRWWWGGWRPTQPLAWNVYGGVWPWHNGWANIAWADGHSRAMRMSQVTAGCDVRDGWTGFIFDKERYLWDLK